MKTERYQRPCTNSIEAYEHYLKGTSLWHERTPISLHSAIKEFEAAATIDPQFAKAHAGLAISWQVISSYTDLSWESTRLKSLDVMTQEPKHGFRRLNM